MRRFAPILPLCLLALIGCEPGADNETDGLSNTSSMLIEAYMAISNTHDVNGFLYEITCDSGFELTEYISLEDEAMPAWISPDGTNHAFSDLLTLVPPGDCHVVATPMQDPDTPSEVCAPSEADVTIEPESTTEIVLISQCEGVAAGALDVIAGLNTPPTIVDIDIEPSKFIIQCEWVTITIDAIDPDGDEVTYTWEVTLTPAGAASEYQLDADGNSADFSADTPGYYEITVTAADESGAGTSLTFPIHVSGNDDIEHCFDPICCETPDGYQTLQEEECAATGGAIAPVELCSADVCCEIRVDAEPEPFITYQTVSVADCDPAAVVAPDRCDEPVGCCRLPDGTFTDDDEETCKDQGGQVADERLCEELCCAVPDADGTVTVATTTLGECRTLGGAPTADDECQETCCRLRGGGFANLPIAECDGVMGFPVEAEFCREQTARVEGLSLDPDAECPPSPYMVIASSAANQLAVYDLDTLAPLGTSPFDTCTNPSRILMLPNTDVVAACRGTGDVRVNRHTRDGLQLWSTTLPDCTSGARGVTYSPEGRLFASCSTDNGNIYELDPASGTIINTVDLGFGIYGLSSDWDGVYACNRYSSQVTKLTVGTGNPDDMTIDWQVSAACYGISGDGQGGIWISQGANLVHLDTATGAQLLSVPMPSSGGGTIVGPDGVVSVGMYSGNAVFRYNPLTATSVTEPMPAGHSGPHGVTVDSAGNSYGICLASHTVIKLEDGQPPVPFSGSVLSSPYNYGGDQAGINFGCVNSTSSTTILPAVDSGDAGTNWLTAEWSATQPANTSIIIEYRIDGGPWQFLANLAVTPSLTTAPIAGPNTGQVFEFQATLSMAPTATAPPSIDWLTVSFSL
ncbi:MAG: streptogramin lyase [Bradymonadia bacterium]|jgi:streptogramin lyase